VYVGHFAAGLAIKAAEPKAPTWALLIGAGLLDLLFGPFVLAGLERATITPAVSPGFSLDYIDWSHSLVMAIVWSFLFAAAFARSGRAVMIALGFAVFSHFLLDLPMHPKDLALWPDSTVHLGFGLWQTLPHGWWFVELASIGALWAYYWRRSKGGSSFGGRPYMIAGVLLLLHVYNAPWRSL
jgi:membrane-bound metal-dependent hydrolase YbcI (DUF457 family)